MQPCQTPFLVFNSAGLFVPPTIPISNIEYVHTESHLHVSGPQLFDKTSALLRLVCKSPVCFSYLLALLLFCAFSRSKARQIDSVSHNLACQMLILMLHFLPLPQDKQKEQHFSWKMNEALQQSV